MTKDQGKPKSYVGIRIDIPNKTLVNEILFLLSACFYMGEQRDYTFAH